MLDVGGCNVSPSHNTKSFFSTTIPIYRTKRHHDRPLLLSYILVRWTVPSYGVPKIKARCKKVPTPCPIFARTYILWLVDVCGRLPPPFQFFSRGHVVLAKNNCTFCIAQRMDGTQFWYPSYVVIEIFHQSTAKFWPSPTNIGTCSSNNKSTIPPTAIAQATKAVVATVINQVNNGKR